MNRREFVKRGSLALAGITVFRPFTANSLESIDRYIIFQQNGATLPEQAAVRELAAYLQLITGATFHTQVAADDNVPEGAIIVGPGPVAEALLPEDALDKLEPEEFLIHTKGQRLLLAEDGRVERFMRSITFCRSNTACAGGRRGRQLFHITLRFAYLT